MKGDVATFQYIADIGGKTAPDKSSAMFTIKAGRNWLQNFTWPIIQQRVSVILHIRDYAENAKPKYNVCYAPAPACPLLPLLLLWFGLASAAD